MPASAVPIFRWKKASVYQYTGGGSPASSAKHPRVKTRRTSHRETQPLLVVRCDAAVHLSVQAAPWRPQRHLLNAEEILLSDTNGTGVQHAVSLGDADGCALPPFDVPEQRFMVRETAPGVSSGVSEPPRHFRFIPIVRLAFCANTGCPNASNADHRSRTPREQPGARLSCLALPRIVVSRHENRSLLTDRNRIDTTSMRGLRRKAQANSFGVRNDRVQYGSQSRCTGRTVPGAGRAGNTRRNQRRAPGFVGARRRGRPETVDRSRCLGRVVRVASRRPRSPPDG